MTSNNHLTGDRMLPTARNQRFEHGSRFYALTLEQDLLGDWTVVTVFGRRGSALGQVRIRPFCHEADAEAYFAAECQRRMKRGYVVAAG